MLARTVVDLIESPQDFRSWVEKNGQEATCDTKTVVMEARNGSVALVNMAAVIGFMVSEL